MKLLTEKRKKNSLQSYRNTQNVSSQDQLQSHPIVNSVLQRKVRPSKIAVTVRARAGKISQGSLQQKI